VPFQASSIQRAALTGAMSALRGDPALRRDLAARGTANLARFSWQKCARTVLTVIDGMLAGGAA